MAPDATPLYPEMAPVEQHLMDRTAEIALARSAAPEPPATSLPPMLAFLVGLTSWSDGTPAPAW